MKSLFIDLKPKCLHHCALRCRKLLNIKCQTYVFDRCTEIKTLTSNPVKPQLNNKLSK